MAVTFDITPIGPDESPEEAMTRIYGGGMQISWTETDDGWEAADDLIEESVSDWEPPPGWADPVIERLLGLYPYQRLDFDDGGICLWDTELIWQVEFFSGGVPSRATNPLLRTTPNCSERSPASMPLSTST
jgi:hypothetical protein